jgi:predicted AlkP superfamily pyrophosphatase or phosphodiesterase
VSRVLPDYVGGSILNLVAGLASHFGVDTGHPPISISLSLDGVETVVLLIVDALGFRQCQRHLESGDLPTIARLLESGEALLEPITSVFPTTTAAALTTLHAARTPAESGMLGYTLWIEALGASVEMIRFVDMARGGPVPQPESILNVPSLYQRLAAAGVCCCAVCPAAHQGSALSHALYFGAKYRSYVSPVAIPERVSEALSQVGPRYVVAYWPDYDRICHHYGPASERARQEARTIDRALDRLVRVLPRDGRSRLILTADHGQRELDPAIALWLDQDSTLAQWLNGPPVGERCGRYLRVKSGSEAEVAEYLAPVADTLAMAEAWSTGLFGGAPAIEEFRARTGDQLVVPRGRRQLLWSHGSMGREEPFRGGHGGWTEDEMLVPLFAIRC